jgi:HTH-type transcriptional regulator, competence development regulator
MMATGPEELGRQLREVRELRGWSLKRVADPSRISAAYLQKLERGDVKDPSPHILHRLSKTLDIPYTDLMRLAGYVVPSETHAGEAEEVNLLVHALSTEDFFKDFRDLSAAEAAELARYLRWYRHDREMNAG